MQISKCPRNWLCLPTCRFRTVLGSFLLVLLIATSAFAAAGVHKAPTVHGVMWEHEGQRILHVWGSPYEMGFAHGYFLGDGIFELMSVYAFPPEGASPWLYELARMFIISTFEFEDADMLAEARGIFDGMIAGGVDPYADVLGRDMDAWDVITFNGLNDIKAAFCATIVAWETATAEDPELGGELVVAHNTDFIDETWEAPMLIAEHSIVISYAPDDPARQRFITIGNSGTLGPPVAFNESGVVAILNSGLALNEVPDRILDPKPQLAGWGARHAISAADVNGDEIYDISDFFAYLETEHLFTSLLEQAVGVRGAQDPPAAVLEISNILRTMRYPADDPNFYPDIFVILNWEDKLVPEREERHQERYDAAVELVNNTYQRRLSVENAWDFLNNMQAAIENTATMQSMIFLPERMQFGLALSDTDAFAPEKEPVWYDFEDLFPVMDDDDDDNDDDNDVFIDDDDDDDDDSFDDVENSDDDAADDDNDGRAHGGCF
ncbi:MAG: hypothetical protein P9L99_03875 [Candidatus Lernaella stagnicola]|nr:hypothetical protein [Candidatus Lernaella stagnicola]